MLSDHVIPKPASIDPYACHQLVAGLTEEKNPLFCDMGDHLLVRTREQITTDPKSAPAPKAGDVRAFELRASCGKKTKGKHRYFPLNDWRSRHEWLRKKADQLGFEVLTVNCTARRIKINKQSRPFHMDQTDFTGILRVIDESVFQEAIENGVGSVGKAFGHSMLIL